MSTYIISYDIAPGLGSEVIQARLNEAIMAYGTWAHITSSCWAISCSLPVVEIRNRLMELIRTTDRLFVLQSSHIAAWNNTLCKSDWLKENL